MRTLVLGSMTDTAGRPELVSVWGAHTHQVFGLHVGVVVSVSGGLDGFLWAPRRACLWAPKTDTSSGRPAVSVMLPRIDVRMTTT